MVDPGIAQAIVRQLNRWYRKRAKPRGTIDHFHRGVRMSYTATYRGVTGFMSGFLLCIAAVLYFVPGVTAGKSALVVVLLKLGWGGIVAAAVGMLLQAFREYAVVTDDGLIKSDLLGRETRLGWPEISQFRIKPDDNKVIFRNNAGAKLALSLAYDGWQDFSDLAARHMKPELYWQFHYARAGIDARRPVSRSSGKARRPRWSSFRRRG